MIEVYLTLVFVLLIIAGLSFFKVRLRIGGKFSLRENLLKDKRERITGHKLTKAEILTLKLNSILNKAGVNRKKFLSALVFSFIGGFLIGLLMFKGLFLGVVTGAVITPAPIFFYSIKVQKMIKAEADVLENAMSIISNAYVSSNDIVKAVETYVRERDKNSAGGIKDEPFSQFVTDVLLVNPDIERALESLGAKINNSFFKQWIKILLLCQNDSSMKFALFPIIKSMNDSKIMEIENHTLMMEVWKEFFTLLALMFSIPLIFRFVNHDWYNIMVGSMGGKLILALMLITALASSFYVLKINKPIDTL